MVAAATPDALGGGELEDSRPRLTARPRASSVAPSGDGEVQRGAGAQVGGEARPRRVDSG
jgi:hypothetical protein